MFYYSFLNEHMINRVLALMIQHVHIKMFYTKCKCILNKCSINKFSRFLYELMKKLRKTDLDNQNFKMMFPNLCSNTFQNQENILSP